MGFFLVLGVILVKERLGVLASGRGSNFQAILEHIEFDILQDAEVGVLISDDSDARALEVSKEFGVPGKVVEPEEGEKKEDFEKRIDRVLQEYNASLVILAGYMRIMSPYLVEKYRNKMMNIHPSLLPSFKGLNSQKKASDYGIKVSGCTIHYVSEKVDSGPIILQHPVPVKEGDEEEDLSNRTLVFEHRLYSKAIQLHIDERLQIENGRVKIDYSDNWEEKWKERQEKFIEYQREAWDDEVFEGVWK